MKARANPSVLQLRSSAGLYGADRVALALAHAMSQKGMRCKLASINNYLLQSQPLHEEASSQSLDAALLPCRGRFDIATVRALSRLMSGGIDVVHVHDYKSAFYALLAARRRPLRLVATLHGWVETSHSLRLYTRLELALLKRFDAVVVVASPQIQRLVNAGIPRARIHQIDNGIEIPRADAEATAMARRVLGLEDASFVFGAVSRLSPEKNLGALIDAFTGIVRADPAAVLVIVGDGPERAGLQAQADALGISWSLRFTGVRNDMGVLYPLFDCVVLPSLSEGMPLVVIEAMGHAIPVVATDVGEVARLLDHAALGRVVPPGDDDALHAALASVIGAGRQRDETAREHVLADHSPGAMANRYTDLYRSLMESRA